MTTHADLAESVAYHEAAHLVVSAVLAPARGVAWVDADELRGLFFPAPTAHLPRWPEYTPRTRERWLTELHPLTAVEAAAVFLAAQVWERLDPFSQFAASLPREIDPFGRDEQSVTELDLSPADRTRAEALAARILLANTAAAEKVAARLLTAMTVWVEDLAKLGIELVTPPADYDLVLPSAWERTP